MNCGGREKYDGIHRIPLPRAFLALNEIPREMEKEKSETRERGNGRGDARTGTPADSLKISRMPEQLRLSFSPRRSRVFLLLPSRFIILPLSLNVLFLNPPSRTALYFFIPSRNFLTSSSSRFARTRIGLRCSRKKLSCYIRNGREGGCLNKRLRV